MMYRFRTAENLLGKYQELEKQEIYFASPNDLNDPMEGYKNIFWNGDQIIWNNFIINYIKSVNTFFFLTILSGRDQTLDETDVHVLSHRVLDKTAKSIKLTSEIIDGVLANKFISDLPKSLEKRHSPVRRNEILSYLQTIHPFVINSISKAHYENKLIDQQHFYQDLEQFALILENAGNLVELSDKMELQNPGSPIEKFYAGASLMNEQNQLIARYNNPHSKSNPNFLLLVARFPEVYLSRLEESIFPNWYSASFLSESTNSAVWGHYGNSHKGICLAFKPAKNNNDFQINLNTINGANGDGHVSGLSPHTFHKIEYTNKHIEIDFFKSIGRLPKAELHTMWYSDNQGHISECAAHLNNNENEWRLTYWENFIRSTTVKLQEWEYEKEYRLMIDDHFIDYSNKESRKLTYQFKDLEGIIFGIKTSIDDKIEIMKIIETKCKKENRKDFSFYQAYYSKDTGKIENSKMSFLKFE